jgi:hypothetical protein
MEVDFMAAVFSGGLVSFVAAEFSGGEVRVDGAIFCGGEVELALPTKWTTPPTGLPTDALGLTLPEWGIDPEPLGASD